MSNAHGFDKGSKVSRIKHWEQVEKSSGHKPEGLKNKPHLGESLLYLWSTFTEIRRGCDRISYSDIRAYMQVTGNDLSPWECQTLINVDEAWRSNG